MSEQKENPSWLFEVSWEVCNKVGGIYEVITSKILHAQEEFNDNYVLLGPDFKNNPDFEETDEAEWTSLKQSLEAKDLLCRFGRWNIQGRPRVILVDFSKRHNNNQLFFELWERYGVDSLSGAFDYQEPVFFSYTCGEVISALWKDFLSPQKAKVSAHFHEWMCGAGLLAVKTLAPEIGTVFTTHATMLGRALAGSGVDIYKQMRSINPKQQAAAHNIIAKSSMERTVAHEADCFTTVSEITAEEATFLLGKRPDIVTTNGLDLNLMPDYSKERELASTCRLHLLEPIEKMLRRKLPEDIKIFTISGRYEYHNKGIDVFLEALANMDKKLDGSNSTVLALFLVMGGHNGLDSNAVSGDIHRQASPDDPEKGFLSPFHVYDPSNDSILKACERLGLHNKVTNKVQIVFVPAMLEGEDGFFNMEYFEVLAGSDLGVFPSWYEPWGYTPHESAAYGVPTVTTDLSGFGIWAREKERELYLDKPGVRVLTRYGTSDEITSIDLEKVLMEYVHTKEEDFLIARQNARILAEASTWEFFYPLYLEAYTKANEKALARGTNLDTRKKKENLARVLTASASTTPLLRTLTAVAELPKSLSRLRELASNLWWVWHDKAKYLFQALNPVIWEKSNHNPLVAIEHAKPEILEKLSHDEEYTRLYNQVMKNFDDYMALPLQSFENIVDEKRPIAYFCCEFGIHESLPIYSGGLGILAGDHMKSVSDLSLPLVGVGLLYRNGYFRQKINDKGRQEALYPYNDFSYLPIEALLDDEGNQIIIGIELPGRVLHVAACFVRVGRTKLYLLDTDIPKNTDADRKISARLYEADRDTRLRQEIVLGMGGVRLLAKLGINPSVYHMNEGHSAFLILERIRKHQYEDHMNLNEAMEFVRNSCVFTTHTPVDAGNERFEFNLLEPYFTTWIQNVGMSWQDFIALGKIDGRDSNHFDLTVLALRFSYKSNGVSWLHGDVSRRMWRDLWQGLALAEVPINFVTNGIHTASFVGEGFNRLLKEYVGHNWEFLPNKDRAWDKIYSIPDDIFWNTKLAQKQILLEKIRTSLPEYTAKFSFSKEQAQKMTENLHSDTLIIGFARRFAPYKRATLLFANPDRLANIISQVNKPIIFVFAGKAHPADEKGIDLIQEIIKYSQDPRFLGKVFFLEDYSLAVSKVLLQGCDVWLNTPRRPYEASGTSGQKIPVNGGVNLSISDGWWCEGFNSSYERANGWTIGPVVNEENLQYDMQDDYADAESLYTLLEETLVPTYYDYNEQGIPHRWISLAKNSMRTLTAKYSTHRMLTDYFEQSYLPTARRQEEIAKDNFALTRANALWKESIGTRFSSVRINDIEMEGLDGDKLLCGQAFTVKVRVAIADLSLEELSVQLVIGTTNGEDFISLPEIILLKAVPNLDKTGVYEKDLTLFTGSFIAKKNGHYAFGIRVMPLNGGHAHIDSSILWG